MALDSAGPSVSIVADILAWGENDEDVQAARTGYSCGTIVSTTFDPGDICGPTGDNPCYSSWIKVTGSNLACYEGDSGGPFFASNTAYGILSAGLSSGTARGQCSVAVFMQTQYIVMMGLEILTGYTG